MANTYPIHQLGVFLAQASELGYAAEYKPEAASATFVAGAPVVLASGLIAEGASPVTAIWGFALRAGQNTTGAYSKVLPAFSGLLFFANFLDTNGAANAIAAADVGNDFQIKKANVLPPSNTACWFVADVSSSDEACRMHSLDTDITLPNKTGGTLNYHQVAVADVSARVTFQPLVGVLSHD